MIKEKPYGLGKYKIQNNDKFIAVLRDDGIYIYPSLTEAELSLK